MRKNSSATGAEPRPGCAGELTVFHRPLRWIWGKRSGKGKEKGRQRRRGGKGKEKVSGVLRRDKFLATPTFIGRVIPASDHLTSATGDV